MPFFLFAAHVIKCLDTLKFILFGFLACRVNIVIFINGFLGVVSGMRIDPQCLTVHKCQRRPCLLFLRITKERKHFVDEIRLHALTERQFVGIFRLGQKITRFILFG
ncbi:MAG: hypothetical protein BWX99_02705 [Deltaproteobacteria bacterium ADurb.Bin151]|nr:MAG: hypothetical protein BWX99_02705 [Deltaproteobacteria bacterium ADurb.Bin151]